MKLMMTLMMTALMATSTYAACEYDKAGKCTEDECKAANANANPAKYVFKSNTCVAIKDAVATVCPNAKDTGTPVDTKASGAAAGVKVDGSAVKDNQ